jgi:hypothetical protein
MVVEKLSFFESAILKISLQKKWKLVNIYRIARIDQNFDDYPGFQQIPGMHILFQQSVSAESAAEVLFTP